MCKEKKNVVVILCDQLRKDFLSCYGFEAIKTPNIDSIAKDGVLFTQATTTSPVCAPARASMMTGRYVSDHGVWTNDVPFREGVDVLPGRMNQCGYRTGAFGKLHHFPGRDGKGFEVIRLMEENRLGEADDYFNWLRERHPEIENLFPHLKDGSFAFTKEEYYETWIANEALLFMEECVENQESFFAWTSFQGPHTPIDPPVDGVYEVDAAGIPEVYHMDVDSDCDVPKYRKYANYAHHTKEEHEAYRLGYCKLIEEIDIQVGRLISFLKEKGVYEDTILVFSADHGDMCGDFGHRQKGPLSYSAQFEIPMILANVDEVQTGSISDALVSNMDIGATVLSLVGDESSFGVSRDMVALAKGEDSREHVFAEFCDSMKIIETKMYRFAYYPFTGQSELFDKTRADYELYNLADVEEYATIKCILLQKMIDHMIISKGVQIESQDLVPSVQQGIAQIQPSYMDDIELVFPLQSEAHRDRLRKAGLDVDYNEFCRSREVVRAYGKYWEN
ncbi:MAG: sulfatase-like hydrolase/transferase [Lachnospiraceae bacterium]